MTPIRGTPVLSETAKALFVEIANTFQNGLIGAGLLTPSSTFQHPPTMFLFVSLSSFLLSCLCYSLIAPHFVSAKQKSWIVTFLGSAAMSACSLPFLRDFLSQRGDLLAVRHRTLLARTICGSFQGFLLSDLVIGSIEYPHQLSPVAGWAHHIIYAFIMPFVVARGWSHVFSLCLSMEIPTFLLASSFLWPKLRNDALYVVVFFWTRIALHASLLLEAILPRVRNGAMGGSFVPSFLLLTAFIMHAHWFLSSAKGTVRRARANSRGGITMAAQELQQSGNGPVSSIHIDSALRIVYFETTKVASQSTLRNTVDELDSSPIPEGLMTGILK